MTDQRAKLRRKSLLHGYIYFDDSPCAVPCIVREMSETGARLQFETEQLPVDGFELDIPLRGQKLRTAVKWTRGRDMGVAFTGEVETAIVPAMAAPSPAADGDLAKRVQLLEKELTALQRLVKRLQQKVTDKVEAG